MSLLKSKKIGGKHSSYIDDAEIVIKAAINDDNVDKVVLSKIIQVSGSGQKRIKFLYIDAGLKITVRGSGAQQFIYVYTNNQEKTRQIIERTWKENMNK